MGQKIRYILFGLFTLTFYVVGIYFNVERQRVLVLQSYSPDYSWTRDVDVGMKRVFGDQSFFSIRWHYMDTKNHPEEESIKKATVRAHEVIRLIDPDVIIAVDDDAQSVAKKYINHPKISIIFSGVNGKTTMYGYDKANNVTGILERLPVQGLKNTLHLLATPSHRPLRIVHLSDMSMIVRLDDEYLRNYGWGPKISLLPSQLVDTFDGWKKAVYHCNQHADYILISNYRKVYKDAHKKQLVSIKEIMNWTLKNATVPIIGLNGFVAEDGARLAVSTSPYEQGAVSAEMAFKVLKEEKKPSDIPIAQTRQFIISLRENAQEFSGLPIIYESFARYANRYYSQPTKP